MLQRWLKKHSSGRVGIEFLPSGVIAVVAGLQGKNQNRILNCMFLPSVGQEEQSEALQKWVEQNNLEKNPCTVLAAAEDYQIFPLERPDVSKDELNAAISWKIKDLLTFPIEAAVIESFDMPASEKNSTKMMNVVASQVSTVQDYVDVVTASGLKLEMLDIPELSLSALLAASDQGEDCIALLSFYDGEGMLAIYKNEDLYVQRDVRLGLRHLKARDSDDSDLFDRILLELQRSMDYFESYYGIGAVTQLMIIQSTRETRELGEYLRLNLGLDVKYFGIHEYLSNKNLAVETNMARAFSAALREPK